MYSTVKTASSRLKHSRERSS